MEALPVDQQTTKKRDHLASTDEEHPNKKRKEEVMSPSKLIVQTSPVHTHDTAKQKVEANSDSDKDSNVSAISESGEGEDEEEDDDKEDGEEDEENSFVHTLSNKLRRKKFSSSVGTDASVYLCGVLGIYVRCLYFITTSYVCCLFYFIADTNRTLLHTPTALHVHTQFSVTHTQLTFVCFRTEYISVQLLNAATKESTKHAKISKLIKG
jgi:hypothetical protein